MVRNGTQRAAGKGTEVPEISKRRKTTSEIAGQVDALRSIPYSFRFELVLIGETSTERTPENVSTSRGGR